MKDIKQITKAVNELQGKRFCSRQEFRDVVAKIISYSDFPTFLQKEGFAFPSFKGIEVSTQPIYIGKIELYIKNKRSKKNTKVEDAIKLLKSKGYVILKPDSVL